MNIICKYNICMYNNIIIHIIPFRGQRQLQQVLTALLWIWACNEHWATTQLQTSSTYLCNYTLQPQKHNCIFGGSPEHRTLGLGHALWHLEVSGERKSAFSHWLLAFKLTLESSGGLFSSPPNTIKRHKATNVFTGAELSAGRANCRVCDIKLQLFCSGKSRNLFLTSVIKKTPNKQTIKPTKS